MTEQEIINIVANMKAKGWNFSKSIVSLVIFLAVIFTITILIIFYLTGNEPTTLIQMFFAFIGIELLGLAAVRVGKDKSKKN